MMATEIGGNTLGPMGALIKRYRQEQRVTQRELAEAAGMSAGALRDLEQGIRRCSGQNPQARVFGPDPCDLKVWPLYSTLYAAPPANKPG